MRKNRLFIIFSIIVALLLVACGNDNAKATTGQSQTQTEINTTEAVEVVETTEEALGKGDAPVVEETTVVSDGNTPVYTGWFAEKIKDTTLFAEYSTEYCKGVGGYNGSRVYTLEYKDIIVQNCLVNPDDFEIFPEKTTKNQLCIDFSAFVGAMDLDVIIDEGTLKIINNDITFSCSNTATTYKYENTTYTYQNANEMIHKDVPVEEVRFIYIYVDNEFQCAIIERDFYAIETALRSLIDGKRECPWVLKEPF